MSVLTKKDINLFAQKILEDYDSKNPGVIYKRIQSFFRKY